jgi:polar amino acid transport system substrate-binding protein
VFAALALPHLRRLLLVPLALLALTAFPLPAVAQGEPEFFERPFAPEQWNIGRRTDESKLRYCVDPRDPAWEVDGAIADAIAQALLLEPVRFVVKKEMVLEDLTKVYEILLKDCDLYMGFKLLAEGYPQWVTLSRPYYEAGYVFVTDDPGIATLADLPAGRPIGATMGTMAHYRLVSYLMAVPAEQRWPAFPFGTNEFTLNALLEGTVDVALVWGPEFWARQKADPAYADFHVIDSNPLPPTTIGVGVLMLSNQKFLRTSVDEAIAALSADGTVAQILESFDFPATAAP